MNCAEIEILLCDYVDGALRPEDRTVLESHLAGCPACRQLADDVIGITAFVERVPHADPPPELLTRILHQAPIGRQSPAEHVPGQPAPSCAKRLFGGFVQTFLQPRYVMGMAMTILSFSMLARFAHIEPRQLRPSDLDPVKVWQGIDDHSHRIYDRAMKYYDNLRLVIEIQTRLKELNDQDLPQGAAGQAPQSPPAANIRGQQ